MKQKGFSLIELIVSLIITMLLVMGIAELLVHSLYAKRKAETHIKITNLVTSRLEQIKTYPFESDELQAGTSSEALKDAQSQEVFCRETKIEDIGSALKRIEVSIFPEREPGKRTQAVLYLSRELGF